MMPYSHLLAYQPPSLLRVVSKHILRPVKSYQQREFALSIPPHFETNDWLPRPPFRTN